MESAIRSIARISCSARWPGSRPAAKGLYHPLGKENRTIPRVCPKRETGKCSLHPPRRQFTWFSNSERDTRTLHIDLPAPAWLQVSARAAEKLGQLECAHALVLPKT